MKRSVTPSAPARFNELWDWITAIDAFDHGDSAPLAKQLRAAPPPEELRGALADIVEQKRKPRAKSAVKLKVPAAERMRVGATVCAILELIEAIAATGEEIATRKGKEPIQIRRQLQADKRALYKRAAKSARISVDTVKGLVRDYRATVKNFPRV